MRLWRNDRSQEKSEIGVSTRQTSWFRNFRRQLLRRFRFRSCRCFPLTEYPLESAILPTSRKTSRQKTPIEHNSFADVILSKSLGSGGTGTVYIATLYGETVAVKIVDSSISDQEVPEEYISSLSHKNLVRIYSVHKKHLTVEKSFNDDVSLSSISLNWDALSSESFAELVKDIPAKCGVSDQIKGAWIMMEYCDLGSLSNFIQRKGFFDTSDLTQPRTQTILAVMKQVADAMVYLHKSGVIHSDLKSQNVFLKTDKDSTLGFIVKIGDFGNCRQPNKKGFVKTSSWGTVDHMPPEALRDNDMRFESDVFSFGMMLWECMTGKRPFAFQSTASILVTIVEGYRPEIPSFVPEDYALLIQHCWEQQWQKRPSFREIQRRLKSMLLKLE